MSRDRMHRQTSLPSLGEYITHTALKLETAVEDRISAQDQADIRRLGFIEMWIHSLAHDADDDATITQYGTSGVSHHAGGCDHGQGFANILGIISMRCRCGQKQESKER